MDTNSIEKLLISEEDAIRRQLQADTEVDRDRAKTVSRLNDTLSHALLRYNAASTGDRPRQAIADSLAAAVRETFAFLLAGTAEKEISRRPVRTGAIVSLLISIICCLGSMLVIDRSFIAGAVLAVLALVLGFTAGRLWYGEREVRIQAGLDPDAVWKTLKKTASTMDRKIDGLCELEKSWEREAAAAAGDSQNAPVSQEELLLLGDLLEALYSQNGEYALRQLKKIRPYLQHKGIEWKEYDKENAELFELLPTKKEASTLRPALVSGDKLLLPGRAAEHVD